MCKKFCPVMNEECRVDCAWYEEFLEGCAVLSISRTLDSIYDTWTTEEECVCEDDDAETETSEPDVTEPEPAVEEK